jgi:hypothetical protein
MQTFRKYEFTPTQWATARKKIELTGTNTDGETYTYWNPEQVAAVHEIGKLCIEWVQTEEGRTCAKESPKVSVDILWAGEPMTTWLRSLRRMAGAVRSSRLWWLGSTVRH